MSNSNISGELLADLRGAVIGPVLTPGEQDYETAPPAWNGIGIPDYDDVRMVWNGMYDRRPDLIVQCMGVADVQAAVKFARAQNLPLAVRGGGHATSGASTIEGGMLIDLALMRGVQVDPESRTAVAAGGTLLWELDRDTQAFGLACPSGAISHTGIAGLTLGGGLGRLMRNFGLTCDNVLGFDLVTADGEWIHVDADHHPDLFWALRGGGGGFGIVTHFHYRLHPLGPIVYGGFLGWPLAQSREVFAAVRVTVDAAPDELQCQYIFTKGPIADFMPQTLQSQPMLLMTATWSGADLGEGARHVAPLRERVAPTLDLVGEFPYTMLQSGADVLALHGRRNPGSMCGYLPAVTEETIELAISLAEEFPTPFMFIELSQMGGAVSRVPADDTPLWSARDAGWLYIVGGNCLTEEEVEPLREWTERGDAEFSRLRLPGRYINFVTDDTEDNVRDTYGEATYERLQEIKAKYDPDGLFARNPNRVPVA